MDEPQAEQLVETLVHRGAPRAAGDADTSQAWYQLQARFLKIFCKMGVSCETQANSFSPSPAHSRPRPRSPGPLRREAR